jgi:hypothetical protein
MEPVLLHIPAHAIILIKQQIPQSGILFKKLHYFHAIPF